MFVKLKEWMSKEGGEAEVIISDGKYELLCFSHPFPDGDTEKIQQPLSCCDVTDVVLSNQNQNQVIKGESYFSYIITAQLVQHNIVELGEIQLSLENAYIPKDLKIGNYITFSVLRIDYQ